MANETDLDPVANADDLDSLDLGGLCGELEPNQPERPTIAAELGRPVATWTCRTSSAKEQMIDARRFKRAVDAVETLPKAGESLHIVTGQEFAGFDLIPAMLQLSGATGYATLTLTTLGFSQRNLDALAKMIEAGQIPAKTFRVLCSDFFRRSDREIWQHAAGQAKRLGYGFRSCRNHTKLILAELGGKFFAIESSANLRSCANLEQFTITQNRKLYDFHNQWLDQVWPTAQE